MALFRKQSARPVARMEVSLQPLHWKAEHYGRMENLYEHGMAARSWMLPNGPQPQITKHFHWEDPIHLACMQRWHLNPDKAMEMRDLLLEVALPVRAVMNSWGKDFKDERAVIITGQCLGFATVDADLGVSAGYGHPIVQANVSHFAMFTHTRMKGAGPVMQALARWMVEAIYYQMRVDDPDVSTPVILSYARGEVNAPSDPEGFTAPLSAPVHGAADTGAPRPVDSNDTSGLTSGLNNPPTPAPAPASDSDAPTTPRVTRRPHRKRRA